MERELILVRGQGFLEVEIDDLAGVGVDVVGERYVRVGGEEQGYQWFSEKNFIEALSKPIPFSRDKESNLVVDYGVKEDDPLKDKIHGFEFEQNLFEENLVFQYQVNPGTGYIHKVLVLKTPKMPMVVSENLRHRPPKVRKGRKAPSF